jgi:hypothetical protein
VTGFATICDESDCFGKQVLGTPISYFIKIDIPPFQIDANHLPVNANLKSLKNLSKVAIESVGRSRPVVVVLLITKLCLCKKP